MGTACGTCIAWRTSHDVGAFDPSPLLDDMQLMPRYLRVLCYHRIGRADSSEELGWGPVISATPEGFSEQLEAVSRFGNVVALRDVVEHLQGIRPLPKKPVLITFDDGYRDNFEMAGEILSKRGLPATLFLSTEWVDGGPPFFWDVAGEAFRRTGRDGAQLPLLGPVEWQGSVQRGAAAHRWIEAAKRVPPDQLAGVVEGLLHALEVDDPSRDLDVLRLRWADAHAMRAAGWEFGAHTARHTILSNVDLEGARREVTESRDRLASELDQEVDAFAYPNGGRADFAPEHVELLAAEGFAVAFTLMSGSVSLHDAARSPLTVDRIFVGNADTLGRFRFKVEAPPPAVRARRIVSRVRRVALRR